MAKDEKKNRKESKKKSTINASTTSKSTTKKMCLNPENTIAKSKKLVEKLQSSRRNCNTKSPRSSSRPNDVSRVCANGKPMPPLSELEKMFEDSDDEQPKTVTSKNSKSVDRSTPHTSTELTSPSTIKKIADKMMDLISNFPDPTNIVENRQSPTIPTKKRKKSEDLYIGGCKDLPNIPKDCDKNVQVYDCSIKEDNDKENRHKGSKRLKTINGSDNINAWLENCEKADHNEGSNDSNKTVEYDYNMDIPIVTPSGRPHSFSPLPSTSRDKETINRNDQLFNASLLSETNSKYNHSINSILNNTTDSDTEIKLSETNKNDKETLKENSINITCNSNADDVEIIQPPPCETIVIDDEMEISRPVKRRISNENDIECIEIVEPDILKKDPEVTGSSEAIVIDDDDGYKFIDDSPPCDDVTEVIDIDDIIAENKAIIDKYSKETKKDINTVTYVNSSTILNLNQDTANSTAPSGNSKTPDNINRPLILTSKRIKDTTEKMQEIVTNYFSNVHQKPTEQISGSAALSSSWNKFSEWWNNLSHRTAANIPSMSRNVQNVETADDSVIIIDTPSPPLDVRHSVISPLLSFCSNNRPSRNQPTVRNNTHENSWTNSTPAENGRHIGVYISGDQTNLDVHITGNNNRSQNFSTTDIPLHMQVAPETITAPHTTTVTTPARAPTPPPVKNYGDCPICMDSLAKNSVASTICGHVFCMKCIEAAFKASGKRCPTCRKVLKKGGYHQLFL